MTDSCQRSEDHCKCCPKITPKVDKFVPQIRIINLRFDRHKRPYGHVGSLGRDSRRLQGLNTSEVGGCVPAIPESLQKLTKVYQNLRITPKVNGFLPAIRELLQMLMDLYHTSGESTYGSIDTHGLVVTSDVSDEIIVNSQVKNPLFAPVWMGSRPNRFFFGNCHRTGVFSCTCTPVAFRLFPKTPVVVQQFPESKFRTSVPPPFA